MGRRHSRCCARQQSCSTPPTAYAHWAAKDTPPWLAFALGWPTTEMAPLYLGGSIFGALFRGWRGDYKSGRGRIALLLKVITWGLLGLIMYRNVKSEPYFETPLAETLGDDYEAVAAQSRPARRRRNHGRRATP